MPASQCVHFQGTGHKGKVLMLQPAGGTPPYLFQPKGQIMQMNKGATEWESWGCGYGWWVGESIQTVYSIKQSLETIGLV